MTALPTNSLPELGLQLNAYDPGRPGQSLRGQVSVATTTTKRFSLSGTPPAERVVLAPGPSAHLEDWTHPKVGWGLIVSDALTVIPEPLKVLVAARRAPVFQYREASEHCFTLLRDAERGIDVDITGAARGTEKGALPYYLLIYGGPEQVPWRLQFALNANRCVGRLPLEGDALASYVEALMQGFADEPSDPYSVVTWSTDHGPDDITRLMRTQIALRVHRALNGDTEIGARAQFLDGATLAAAASGERLVHAISTARPGLIVTTSHGQTGPVTDVAEMTRMLGVPVDQAYQPLDVDALTDVWLPGGAVWYCHACCSAGTDAPSAFSPLFPETTDIGRVLHSLAAAGPRVAPLPLALLGAKRPLRAFIGHVEPTFDWTLRHPSTSQPLTSGIVGALYPNLYQLSPRTTVGHAFREWFQRLGPLLVSWEEARARYDAGGRNTEQLMLYQLAARDVQSTVILGDPAAMLPLRPGV